MQTDVRTELRTARHADLLQRWLQTSTWIDSRRFLQQHRELASEPRTQVLLEAAATDPMMGQHPGIVRLVAQMDIAGVYDNVTNLNMAVDTAMSARAA